MNSLAIIRATDILKLKSTLQEMTNAGLNFETKPKEINPAYIEKILSVIFSPSEKNYDVCALVPITQDYELSQSQVKTIPVYSDVFIMEPSSKLFNDFVKMIPLLPDLIIPHVYAKDINKKISDSKERSSKIYLSAFINRKVQVETGSRITYSGVLKHVDSIGVFFEHDNDSAPIFITWTDINKIILAKEEKEEKK